MPDSITPYRREADVPSPCVGICTISADRYCIGCFRTIDELRGWWSATADEKRAILKRCDERAKGEQARAG